MGDRRLMRWRRVYARRRVDRDAFADQLRTVARQAAALAWDECAQSSGLADGALAELLDRNPWRADDDDADRRR